MRPGQEYSQRLKYDEYGNLVVTVPLELVEEWDQYIAAIWTVNPDGSITLTKSNG